MELFTKMDDKSKYLKICTGDIGYNTMRMWQGVSAYSYYEGIVSPAYTVLKPINSIDSKYFSYLFKMPEIIFMFYRYSQGLVDDTRSLKYQFLSMRSEKISPSLTFSHSPSKPFNLIFPVRRFCISHFFCCFFWSISFCFNSIILSCVERISAIFSCSFLLIGYQTDIFLKFWYLRLLVSSTKPCEYL